MRDSVSVRVWSDFVCPWCYVGLAEVDRLRTKYAITVDWQPFLLRPDTPPEGAPLPDYVKTYMKDPNNPLMQRVRAAGLPFVERTRVPSTRLAHEATEWARAEGGLDAFHAAVLRAHWARGEDISAPAVLQACATEASLSGSALVAALESGKFKAQTEALLEEARAIGVTAVPTFLVDEQFVIQGAQAFGVFEQAMQRLGATSIG
jgi:predicted DsbA family dithiol-disulfide isomerase